MRYLISSYTLSVYEFHMQNSIIDKSTDTYLTKVCAVKFMVLWLLTGLNFCECWFKLSVYFIYVTLKKIELGLLFF